MTKAIVGKWGKSLAIRVPLDVARTIGLGEGEQVSIEAVQGGLHIHRETVSEEARRRARIVIAEIKAEAKNHRLNGLSIREMIDEGRR